MREIIKLVVEEPEIDLVENINKVKEKDKEVELVLKKKKVYMLKYKTL